MTEGSGGALRVIVPGLPEVSTEEGLKGVTTPARGGSVRRAARCHCHSDSNDSSDSIGSGDSEQLRIQRDEEGFAPPPPCGSECVILDLPLDSLTVTKVTVTVPGGHLGLHEPMPRDRSDYVVVGQDVIRT